MEFAAIHRTNRAGWGVVFALVLILRSFEAFKADVDESNPKRWIHEHGCYPEMSR
jgi:hypothetical protein